MELVTDNDNFLFDMAGRLRLRSSELNIKQADIVRRTGAAKSTVNAWFAGKTAPRGAYITKLCALLRCSQDWLLGGKGSPQMGTEVNLMAAMRGTWECASFSQIDSELVRVPAIYESADGYGLNECDARLVPREVMRNARQLRHVGYLVASSRTAAPAIVPGDLLVVDCSVNVIKNSGAYYAIGGVGVVNAYQVFVEVDGSLSIVDAQRGTKTVIERERRDSVDVVGAVIYRAGSPL